MNFLRGMKCSAHNYFVVLAEYVISHFLPSDWLQCAYLEASNCQVESRYLSVLKRLQETKSLDPVQRQAVHKMIEDALKGELKSVVKLNTIRYSHLFTPGMI